MTPRPGDLLCGGSSYAIVTASSAHKATVAVVDACAQLRQLQEREQRPAPVLKQETWYSHVKGWEGFCPCEEQEWWCPDGNGEAWIRVVYEVAT